MTMQNEDDLDEIFDYAEQYDNDEPIDGKYYLGTIFKPENDLLLELRIHIPLFFKFPIEVINRYARPYSSDMHFTNRIEIVQLQIIDDCYFAIIKTFWLREFQRIWKRIYNERQEWIQSVRKNPTKYLDNMQRTGYRNGSFIKCH